MPAKQLSLLGISMGLLACAGQPTPIPENTSTSAIIYRAKCSLCHALPHPRRHTNEQWQHIVAMMEQRMQERKFAGLSRQERTEIMAYLGKHAR